MTFLKSQYEMICYNNVRITSAEFSNKYGYLNWQFAIDFPDKIQKNKNSLNV